MRVKLMVTYPTRHFKIDASKDAVIFSGTNIIVLFRVQVRKDARTS
jgi:hypothetical protein